MQENIAKVKHVKNIADQKNDSIPPSGAHDPGILTGEAAWRQIYSWAGAPATMMLGIYHYHSHLPSPIPIPITIPIPIPTPRHQANHPPSSSRESDLFPNLR